ncbi:hypothetical protein KC332_g8019 [Hortaea werneckii]|uniref:DUF202 domain-containing protein n=1 Tax=Hortaea werneckii EXF-2000 TaxID=1157616 RepID=A0A1Z5TBJ0_HORWE|nr:hypothetical protein KC350_g11393 [Hortaea werneckii]OTA33386.1 hypothetical protein BTJ68_07370 [Hortaea werneckii EXF-2000]KAI6835688.1 hypothetical protein KC342_g5532 [Hortaea werneckii]KAI6842775.1 hypothetical protein KC358_g4029 [Hortaea werneckii]KAI6939949.1 hypothetical protein KC341_g3837 [Hortaea werneckii]
MEDRSSEPISKPPEAVHPRPTDIENESDNEREATELHTIAEQHRARLVTAGPGRPQRWHDDIKRVWRHHVRLSVPHADCRDHLANERTYLGYLRTSLALSMVGVIISQLYRLQHSPSPNSVYGYYVLGKPLASSFHTSALVVTLVGAVRFFRQQSAMSIGKIHAGGWEVLVICGGMFLLLLAVFALHVAVDVYDAS